jgi:hypothetical protein
LGCGETLIAGMMAFGGGTMANNRLVVEIGTLPFVRHSRGGGDDGCFWSVTSSGDYHTDYRQGQEWALLVLPFLNYNAGIQLLCSIVDDMVKTGPYRDDGGLVLGFMHQIGAKLLEARAGLIGDQNIGPTSQQMN